MYGDFGKFKLDIFLIPSWFDRGFERLGPSVTLLPQRQGTHVSPRVCQLPQILLPPFLAGPIPIPPSSCSRHLLQIPLSPRPRGAHTKFPLPPVLLTLSVRLVSNFHWNMYMKVPRSCNLQYRQRSSFNLFLFASLDFGPCCLFLSLSLSWLLSFFIKFGWVSPPLL